MLFFLWGVFRARRVHGPDSSQNLYIPSSSLVSEDKHIPTGVKTLSENLCLPERMDEESSACERYAKVVSISNASDQMCAKITDCDEKKASPEKTCVGPKANLLSQDSSLDSKPTCNVSSSEEMRCTSPPLVIYISI